MKIKQMTPLFITDRLQALKSFYTEHLHFKVTFDSEGFLGLRSAEAPRVEISFMPSENEPTAVYQGSAAILCLEVEDVDGEYERLKREGVLAAAPPKDNPWGDRSFVVEDPIGISLYIHKPIPAAPEYLQYVKE